MAAGARRINMCIFFFFFLTNRKLPLIHSVSVPRSRSKARAFSYAEKLLSLLYFTCQLLPVTSCNEVSMQLQLCNAFLVCLHVLKYIKNLNDILKLFENIDADLSWPLYFLRSQLVKTAGYRRRHLSRQRKFVHRFTLYLSSRIIA